MGAAIKIFAIFKVINNRYPDMKQHKDRLNIQKLTYILQSIGLDLGYTFSWYVKGPYSTELASDAFRYTESESNDDIGLTKSERNSIEKLQSTFSDEIKDPNKLELYASLLFIKKQNNLTFLERGKLADNLTSLKPWFSKEETIAAIEKLKRSGIFGG